jgi:hypothetical protein
MTRKRIVAGVSGAAVGLLLATPALGYQGGAGQSGVGAGTSASVSALPNTSAAPPAADMSGLMLAGAAVGGSLIALAGLELAVRRRRSSQD